MKKVEADADQTKDTFSSDEPVMEDRSNSSLNQSAVSDKSPTMAPCTGPEKEDQLMMHEKEHEAEDSVSEQEENQDEVLQQEQEEEQKQDETLTEEEQLALKRRREKRLALNRASARERRKRKRLLIEELTEKNKQLSDSNRSLRRANEELRAQVSHLTTLIAASPQPALSASVLGGAIGQDPLAAASAAGLDPLVAASLLAPPPPADAAALAALREQERLRALLEVQDARMTLAAQIPAIPSATLASASADLGRLQQRQNQALLARQLGLGSAAGRAPDASRAAALLDSDEQELLRAVGRGGHPLVERSPSSASRLASQRALSAPVSDLPSSRISLSDIGVAGLRAPPPLARPGLGRTALDVLHRARRNSESASEEKTNARLSEDGRNVKRKHDDVRMM